MRDNKIYTEWDEETGVATCLLMDKQGNVHVGQAICHPEDKDMKNKFTGLEIASKRAVIKYFCHIKNNEIKPTLKALKHFYHSINSSKDYDENNYIVKRLLKHIEMTQADLDALNSLIADEREGLKNFIQDKESFYQKVRKNRMDNFKEMISKKF